MNILHDQLKEKLVSVEAWKDKQEKCYQTKQRDLLQKSTAHIDQTGNDLNMKIEQFTKLYQTSPHLQKSADSFVFQKRLDDIFKEEDAFTISLTKYTREQFSGGIADLASGRDKSKYEMLDTSKPETFLIKGGNFSGKHRERDELKRLQSAYMISKLNSITAEMSHVKYKKAVEVAERQVKMLKTVNFDVTGEQVAEKVDKLNHDINNYQNMLSNCYVSELTPLLEKLQSLNSTKVIQGDYNLKLLRQDYFLSKQDEVIKQLLVQFSRNYFLTMLYEIEYKSQKGVHHLFSTLHSLLEDQVTKVEKQISHLNGLLLEIKSEKHIISSNDLYMNAIYEAIHCEPSDKELYRSYSHILSSVNALSVSDKRTNQKLTNAEEERSQKFHLIETTLNNIDDIMQSPGDKSNEELALIISNIEENLLMAENQINEVIKDLMGKKTLLSVDNIEELKRKIFSDFFNDPARLKRNLDDLISRVKGLTGSVKNS